MLSKKEAIKKIRESKTVDDLIAVIINCFSGSNTNNADTINFIKQNYEFTKKAKQILENSNSATDKLEVLLSLENVDKSIIGEIFETPPQVTPEIITKAKEELEEAGSDFFGKLDYFKEVDINEIIKLRENYKKFTEARKNGIYDNMVKDAIKKLEEQFGKYNYSVKQVTELTEKEWKKYLEDNNLSDYIQYDEYNQIISKMQTKFQDKLLEHSKISQKDAIDWYKNNVIINDNARKELNKQGYSDEFIDNIFIKFYRITNGKLNKIKVDWNGRNERAYFQNGGIMIEKGMTEDTFFHELGHAVDATNPKFFAQIEKDFILKRATTNKLKKLSELTGMKYTAKEKAYPDDFIDPYVGKLYNHDATEVLSMAIGSIGTYNLLTSFGNSFRFTKLMTEDNEHLSLMLGLYNYNTNNDLKFKNDFQLTEEEKRDRNIMYCKRLKKHIADECIKAGIKNFINNLPAPEEPAYFLEGYSSISIPNKLKLVSIKDKSGIPYIYVTLKKETERNRYYPMFHPSDKESLYICMYFLINRKKFPLLNIKKFINIEYGLLHDLNKYFTLKTTLPEIEGV